jgi:ferredoxin
MGERSVKADAKVERKVTGRNSPPAVLGINGFGLQSPGVPGLNHPAGNFISINPARCKGCGVCVASCPKGCIALGSELNRMGYRYARFEQHGCIACGLCFYCCPEFGGITVCKKK